MTTAGRKKKASAAKHGDSPNDLGQDSKPVFRRLGLGHGFGRFVALIAFTVTMAAIGMMQVSSRYELVRYGYAIDQDLFEYRRLQEANKRLALYRATTLDPNQVRIRAEDQLGMQVPGQGDELFVPDPRTDTHQSAYGPANGAAQGIPGEVAP